jgi:hypothetical protein
MVGFLIVLLALVVLLALMVILVLADLASDTANDQHTVIEMEVRRAERRLHDLARTSFETMLTEARNHERIAER